VVVGQAVRGLDHDPSIFPQLQTRDCCRVLPEIDGQIVSFEQVGQWFLTELIEKLDVNASDVQQSLGVDRTCDSFEAYRHWLGGANFAGGAGADLG